MSCLINLDSDLSNMQFDLSFIIPQAAMKTWTRPTRQKLSQASITISTQWGHDPRATGASSGQYWITHRLNLIRISHNIQTHGKDLCKRIHNSLSAKTGCHMGEVWSAIKPVDTGLSCCGVLLFCSNLVSYKQSGWINTRPAFSLRRPVNFHSIKMN